MKSEKIQTCEVTASIWLAFLTVITIATLLCACSSDSGDSFTCATGSVRTSSGIVCGKVVSPNGREVHAFLGIPYGETTVGDNRWRDPIPKAAASELIHATEFGPGCPQTLNPPYTPTETSEDCLSLNIWRPADLEANVLQPVMVWIYGGSFLMGSSSMPIYDGAFGGKVDAATYTSVLTLIFGIYHVPDIIALYGINPFGDNSEYLVHITTDYLFGCANRFVARQAVSDLYAYEFDENSINIWPNVVQCEGKACHGDDIPFTFHTDTQLDLHFTDEQNALSSAMVAYWGAFATHLNPDVDGLLAWPPFTSSLMEYMILVTPENYIAADPTSNCDFWDQIGYNLRPPSLAATAALLTPLRR